MKLPISPRLLACAKFINPGERVADVGTDHGYLTIYLRREGLASHVYAADIAPKPLANARENCARYEITEGVSFHLCDGVRGLPREFDTLVMAGMGAETMVQILKAGPWLRNEKYRLILQCQSSQNELRLFLSQNGWKISREEPVKDGKFVYTVIEALRGEETLTPGQQFASPALFASKDPLKKEYITFVRQATEKVVAGLSAMGGEKYEFYKQAFTELKEMEEKL